MSAFTEEQDKKMMGTPLTSVAKKDVRRTRAYQLGRNLQIFYRSHLVSAWQRKKVQEIRDMCKEKTDAMERNTNIAIMELECDYMEHELAYLEASSKIKEENGGKAPIEGVARIGAQVKGFLSSIFSYGKKAN